MYLAIEALLSDVVAPVSRSNGSLEGDGDWLKRALREIGKTSDLSPYAPESSRALHNAIHHELYVDLRTAIFHAKQGRATWTPQDWSSRETIVAARVRYAGMFRSLASHYLGITYPGGGWTNTFWEQIWDGVLSESRGIRE